MAACRSCGAVIVWSQTLKGAMIPMEVKEGGDAVLVATADAKGGTVTMVPKGTGTHVTHFANCPNAKAWRNPSTPGVEIPKRRRAWDRNR